MKEIIFVVFIFCFSVKTFAQTQFAFSGEVIGAPNAAVMLRYTNSHGKFKLDSCVLKDGKFNFKVDIAEPTMVFASVYVGDFKIKSDDDPNTVGFFLEPGNITATGHYDHLKELKISGSKTQKEFESLNTRFTEVNNEVDPISNDFDKVNHEYIQAKKKNKGDKILDSLSKKLDSIKVRLEPFRAKYEDIVHHYIITHPDSYVSAFEMTFYVRSWPLDSVKRLYNKFNPAIQNSSYGKEIQKSIATIDNNSLNKKATDFASTDINGKPVCLADFKGRYVLLDFWASWCVPCRQSTPHLIQLFKKYNKAGLEVIAVADDDNDHNAWKKAVKKDGTEIWHNILRGLIRNNMEFDRSKSISDLFAVSLLPTKILIDKNGVIIGRYTGTEDTADLDKKLAEVFH
jgi:thiol-disulfide isomerase/thioredoxin